MKPYDKAARDLKRVGASRAEGPSRIALYAQTAAMAHGLTPKPIYDWLVKQPDAIAAGKEAVADRTLAWDIAMGIAA